jgi:hypothetical protein
MDKLDVKIFKAINDLFPDFFISPIAVNDIIKIDENNLGDSLMVLKNQGI